MKAWQWTVWIALCIVPLAVAAASLGSLPDTVALHVGPGGVIDRYGSKYEILRMAALLASLPRSHARFLESGSALRERARPRHRQPRNLRTLFLVLGTIDTVILSGIMLSFGRGVLAG